MLNAIEKKVFAQMPFNLFYKVAEEKNIWKTFGDYWGKEKFYIDISGPLRRNW